MRARSSDFQSLMLQESSNFRMAAFGLNTLRAENVIISEIDGVANFAWGEINA